MIKRKYDIANFIKPQRVLVIVGPRRLGKTTLLNDFLSRTTLKFKLDSGDNIQTQQVLSSQDFKQILDYASGYDLIAIDDAQQIPNIGMGLKILVDQMPNLIVVATGSSAFDLVGAIGEPLTGRKITLILYPFAHLELLNLYNAYEMKAKLEDFLIFGAYPEVITAQTSRDKIAFLEELVHSYLLKDVLKLDRIKGAKVLLDLLKLLSFQIGAPGIAE
jgi:predicted AAA+ superfamily ATPase